MNFTANRLLATLPNSVLNLIEPHCTAVAFEAGTIVHLVGDEIDFLCFPIDGLASLQIAIRDGRCIDTAMAGRDGVLGPMAGVGRYKAKSCCVARSRLRAIKISALEYRRIATQHYALTALCIDYNDRLLSQTQINAARYALLSVDARLAA